MDQNNQLGNTENSTSRRLAAITGKLNGLTFKETIGINGGESRTNYVLPPDVKEEDFLAFIEDVEKISGKDNVDVNVDPANQGKADYVRQPKFYVGRTRTKMLTALPSATLWKS